jgi:P-type Ca2+ transporter type 2C
MKDILEPEKTFLGLSSSEAQERLKTQGYNELLREKKNTLLHIALEVAKEPMFILLLACGATYFILGDIGEALMLLAFVFFVMGITIYQERKVERALEALKDLSSPRALVIRDGQQKRIPGREVVTGDILVLNEGDRVPADSLILSSSNLLIDESLLTGESVSVRKTEYSSGEETGRPGGDDLPYAYSSTLIVQGHGIARVTATGGRTEVGKIGKALQAITEEQTQLQKETGKLVKIFGSVGFILCTLVVVIYGLTRGDWVQGFLAGLALAMAILPEEFPVVLTIFLALGAWRMSQRNVLTRRLPAIQNLGAATVLCVDKTGTLTMNRMTVKKLDSGNSFYDLKDKNKAPEEFHELMEYSVLASQKDPFDPMEKAIREMGKESLSNTEHLHEEWTLVKEYPLSRELLALSHVWRSPNGKDYVIAAKGAPEAIIDLCHLDAKRKEEIMQKVLSMSNSGLRVLGVAKALFRKEELPENLHDFRFEYIGLLGFEDPVRPNVTDSVAECYSAGMRVIMITGDYPGTAKEIAKQAGFVSEGIISGQELDSMSDKELSQRIKTTNIFARVVPEQKLRIVQALKSNGEIVVMTGDGVNDAPALKAAHIGIAMGGRGTEVARESAALVLLDDDFSSIVRAVRMGRRIYDNIKKAMSYIIAVHVPIAGMTLIPVLMKWPMVLGPVHIAFLELIIDPVCSVVFEAESEEKDIMKRRPRRSGEPLFDKKTILLAAFQGLSILIIVAGGFGLALSRGHSDADARALAFTTLIFANIGLIFSMRSQTRTVIETLRQKNTALWYVIIIALSLLALVLYVPFLQILFSFSSLDPRDLLICLTGGVISVLWFEAFKLIERHRAKNG